MFTLMLIAAFALASCLAAAGLIASTRNNADVGPAMTGLDDGRDLNA
jgi:hypothetical protein